VHRYVKGDKKGKSKPINEIQSLKIEGIGFELVKKEQYQIFEMISLLNRLDTKSEEIGKTINDLQKSFGRKYHQHKKLEDVFWGELLKKIEWKSIEDWIQMIKDEIKRIEDEWESKGLPIQPPDDQGRRIGPNTESLKEQLEWCLNLQKQKKNAKRWVFNKKLSVEDQHKILKIDLLTPLEEWKHMSKLKDPLWDTKGSGTPENFLFQKGIEKPKDKSDEELSNIFRIILFNIMNSENYKVLQNSLAWALSDEKDSLEWFEMFIEGMSSITPLKERLSKQLNIKSKNQVDPYAIEAAAIRKANENRGKIDRYDKSNDLGEQLTMIIKEIVSQN
jgi:hypothetical protein